ncbi:hypothetical protein LJE71_20455 [Xanthobacter autotrophicus]|uniref:hypothetical protein n=1 Tax=Xanthobacter TaxID=279 RepID=UPI001E2D099D|nr:MULTISPECIES: hypothetical protein [Xanthobacter]UDQ88585.1 hypothetical protein LJE71_20455 [Xanthobacter autotrophicus]
MTAAYPDRAIARDLGDLILAGCGIGEAAADDFKQLRDFIALEALDLELVETLAGSLMLARCAFSPPPRRFHIDPAGELAVVVEVLEIERGERWLVDHVAWPIDRPSEFATAEGRADLLGTDQVDNPASFFGGRPLFVHRTPLGWLRAGCQGVVVLDERRAGARLAGALGNLLAEDLDHARELHRLMGRAFPTNRIRVPASSIHRGAA